MAGKRQRNAGRRWPNVLAFWIGSHLLLLLVVGCMSPADTFVPAETLMADRPTASSAASPPTATTTPTTAASPVPTAMPTPQPTAAPTPVPTHPLMVELMRADAYPGSELVIEETLSPGSNYDRTIVSYLSEGLKIYALLTVPRGEKPATGWPVVIFNHGYIPPAQYRTTERYIAYTDAFSRNGYMLLRPDYRGNGFSEGIPANSYASPAYTVDVLNAMASVMAHPDVDPNRVGMWGHSMGGSITLRAMVVTDTIKAGVIWAGVTAPYPMIIQRWAERWADRRRLSAIGLWLEDNPVLAPWVLVGVALVLNAAVLLVARNLIARGLVYLAQRSKTRVDDILVKHMRPYRFAWLVPLLLTYFLATWVPQWTETAQTLQGAELGQHDHGRADAQATRYTLPQLARNDREWGPPDQARPARRSHQHRILQFGDDRALPEARPDPGLCGATYC